MWFTKQGRAKAALRKWFVEAQATQNEAVKARRQVEADEHRAAQDGTWNQVGR